MKKAIITIAVLLSCVIASAQIPVICQAGQNKITHSETGGSYTLIISDEIGGKVDILAINKTEMLGTLDIMEGVLSGKYPNLVGLYCGGDFAKLTRDTEGGLLVSYKDNFVVIDAQTIAKFKEAVKAQK